MGCSPEKKGNMQTDSLHRDLAPLFEPDAVVVVGASNDRNKWGYSTFKSLLDHFEGELHPVNLHAPEILGRKAYSRVIDVPGAVDLAVIVIPPEGVAGVMEDCVSKGVRAAVIITAGFAEVGPKGKALQDEVVRVARKGGIRLVGPNCMGMWSAARNLTAFMFPMRITDGPLALISQGGNIGGALVADATARGVGFRHYVSCGCTADIQIEDYIEYMGEDETVKVIMVYIEGLGDGNRFVRKVSRVTRKKPVVALKPGKTDAAARAISSHSGALSGQDALYEAAFRRAGVLRVDSSTELLDVAIGLLTQPLPAGRRVVITTPGGSYGVMCAEACALRGLEVIPLPERAMAAFNAMFPERWSHGNPVDPAGDRDFVQYLKAPEIVLQCPEVDALIFMGFGTFSGISSVFAGGKGGPGLRRWVGRLADRKEMAGAMLEALDSGDPDGIRKVIRPVVEWIFAQMMPGRAKGTEDFMDSVTEALTDPQMLKSSLYDHLKAFFRAVVTGDDSGLEAVRLFDLMDPVPGAIVRRLTKKYQKPVITTTFTEGNTRLSEASHFPYPNSDRASNVLAKLLEYREYLDGAGVRV
ncbi:MAG: hypothetical protein DRH20_03260 [Deltaproteobacteria bacterium]|nr:MAG: hypothetical protein DRH20_03260 [Deltaproteobacteria bacterium]